jgi:hypothetical protein
MARLKTFLIAVVLTLLALVAVWLTLFGKIRLSPPKSTGLSENQETQTAVPQNKVFLTITFAPDSEIDYEKQLDMASSTSVFDLLKEALDARQITYETKTYNFGVFVSSINGQVSGSDKAWIYFVNGQSAQVAADKYVLKPQDVVEWKYIEPN